MPIVTRFHFLIFLVTLSITVVAILRIPPTFLFQAHWHASNADWLWPRDIALSVAPAIQATVLLAFWLLGRALTKNHLAKTRHILDPGLTLLLAVPAVYQLGLLFLGIGSDLDLIRGEGFLLGATLALLGLVLFHAERHSYGGLRLPWTIRSDRAWALAHKTTGVMTAIAGLALIYVAWTDPGAGVLAVSFAAALFGLPVLAALMSLAVSRA